MRRETFLLVAAGAKAAECKLILQTAATRFVGPGHGYYVPCFAARARSNMPQRAGAAPLVLSDAASTSCSTGSPAVPSFAARARCSMPPRAAGGPPLACRAQSIVPPDDIGAAPSSMSRRHASLSILSWSFPGRICNASSHAACAPALSPAPLSAHANL